MSEGILEESVRGCVAELAQIARAMPELSGFELAFDRGNIDGAEWESVQATAAQLREAEQAVLARLEALRDADPAAMSRLVSALAARLTAVTPRLPAYEQAHVVDVIASLTAWAAQQRPAYAVTWAWRVGHDFAAR